MKLAHIIPLILLAGCAGSKRTATPPPARPAPDVTTEISVIPRQELKGNRPYVGFNASFGQSTEPAVDQNTLGPNANPISVEGINSDEVR